MIKEHISFGVNVDTNYRIPSDTFIRLFGGVEKNAIRPNLKVKLFELTVLKDKESSLDFIRVFVLFGCNCILFPKTMLYTSYFLFSYVDGLKRVRELAWGTVVYRSLVDGIFKWKSIKASLPPERKKNEDGTAPKILYVEGCAFVLLVWVYEHLEEIILRPTRHVGISKMFRWLDKHAPSSPEATLELLSQVKTHEIVELYPSNDETEKLLIKTPAPQLVATTFTSVNRERDDEEESEEAKEEESNEEDAERNDDELEE
ncbi:hypothetical protein Drorol1_Dr00004109 [Drosera rotundifolia]